MAPILTNQKISVAKLLQITLRPRRRQSVPRLSAPWVLWGRCPRDTPSSRGCVPPAPHREYALTRAIPGHFGGAPRRCKRIGAKRVCERDGPQGHRLQSKLKKGRARRCNEKRPMIGSFRCSAYGNRTRMPRLRILYPNR